MTQPMLWFTRPPKTAQAVVIAACTLWTLPSHAQQAEPSRPPALRITVDAKSTPTLWRPLTVMALSTGGAALIGSGVMTLVALSMCSGGRCSDDEQLGGYRTLRGASTVAFYLGATFAVVGLVSITLTALDRDRDRDRDHTGRFTLGLGPASAVLKARF